MFTLTNPPAPIKSEGDKKLWIINDAQIWARSYTEACELYELIY